MAQKEASILASNKVNPAAVKCFDQEMKKLLKINYKLDSTKIDCLSSSDALIEVNSQAADDDDVIDDDDDDEEETIIDMNSYRVFFHT